MNVYINTVRIRSDAKKMLKGHYGGIIVVALTLLTATSLFSYLQSMILVAFGLIDAETGAYAFDPAAGFDSGLAIFMGASLLCSVLSFILTTPLTIGATRYLFNFVSGRSPRVEEMFTYLSSGRMFGRTLSLSIRVTFLKIMWGIVCFVPGFAAYAYGIYISDIPYSELLSGEAVTVTDPMALSYISAGSLLLLAGAFIYLFRATRYFLASYILASDDEITPKLALAVAVRMAKGRVGQYILLILSFFGWTLLSILTCGVLFLFTVPYMAVTFALYSKTVIDINLNPPPPQFPSMFNM